VFVLLLAGWLRGRDLEPAAMQKAGASFSA
jgi:hypothetical protein